MIPPTILFSAGSLRLCHTLLEELLLLPSMMTVRWTAGRKRLSLLRDEAGWNKNSWLPRFAQRVSFPPPSLIPEQEALAIGGEDAVYYGTRLLGASNQKALKMLGFQPRRLEWIKD
jgi:hypothetical protein